MSPKAQTTAASPFERPIQWGLLVLVAVMPFHAFLSVWLGHVLGHQALIQAWKESLLLLLALAGLALLIHDRTRWRRLNQPWIWAAASFGAIAVLVTIIARPSLTAVAFGLKTDLAFLLAGILAALVGSAKFGRRLMNVVLVTAGMVVAFGLLQIFVLPPDFLVQFGYGPATILPYQHITTGASALRFAATLGGPNQLGTYLILPLCLALTAALRQRSWWLLALPIAGSIVLVHTYSRSAWIGAAAALTLTLVVGLPRQLRRWALWSLAGLTLIILAGLPSLLAHDNQLQYYLLHASFANHSQNNVSDSQHAASLMQGLQAVAQAPLGHGLGTAGPAAFHTGAGNVIENYYLQLGYETGLLGMALFIAAISALGWALWRKSKTVAAALPVAAALLGVSLVAVVLPAWVDSSTALILWVSAGSLLGKPADV